MQLRATLSAAAAALILGLAGAAAAQTAGVATPPADTPGQDPTPAPAGFSPTFTFNAGGNTDYVFRGVSQTDEKAQGFIGVDAASGSFYAGAWGSNVDFNNGTDFEYDVYAGFKPVFGSVTLDIGGIYYGYLGSPSGSDQDYVEAKVAASTTLGGAGVGAGVYYSPDFFGGTGDAWYYEVNASVPLLDNVSLGGAVGRQEVEGPADYTTGNIGLTVTPFTGFSVDLRYFRMKDLGLGGIDDDRITVGFKVVAGG